MSAPIDVSLDTLSAFPLPSLAAVGDKEGRGRVMVVGGSARVPGAGLLTGVAALRAGAGKLQLVVPKRAALALGVAIPEAAVVGAPETPDGEIAADGMDEAVRLAARADAVVVGPGMMDEAGAGRIGALLMAACEGSAFVLDAAALTGTDFASAPAQRLAGRLVLTPHAGEMARLTGLPKADVEKDPLAAARRTARAAQAVVIMKGADSYIVSPDGRAWRHAGGVIGLATAGSGDVLAGVIGGLLGRGASPLVAAVWGVCVHAAAGARLSASVGPVGFLARELLAEVPRVLASVVAA